MRKVICTCKSRNIPSAAKVCTLCGSVCYAHVTCKSPQGSAIQRIRYWQCDNQPVWQPTPVSPICTTVPRTHIYTQHRQCSHSRSQERTNTCTREGTDSHACMIGDAHVGSRVNTTDYRKLGLAVYWAATEKEFSYIHGRRLPYFCVHM